MAPDLPLELDDRRDPAMLRASDPLVEVLLGKIGILEREHGLETFLQPVPSRQGPVLRLDHRQPLALPFRQVLLVLAEGVFRVPELFDRLLRLLDLGPEPVLPVGLGLLRLPRLPLQVEQAMRARRHESSLTESNASLAHSTTWNGSTQRSAFGQYCFIESVIQRAPSPVTTRTDSRCSGAGSLKKRSSTSLPCPLCAQTTVLVSWLTTIVM